MKRAILMSRVSSDEQAKGYSLDIQVEKLSEHCRKENYLIINVFKEDHSAKNFNRPEFKKLLIYLKQNKGKVDLLLITTWDRFSRNLTESFSMIEQLKNLGVEVQAIDQPLDLTVPENLMILSVYLALPDIDNKRRSIKITEGVRAGKASGRWQNLAPYGYRNSRDEGNKPIIVPNEKAETVKTIFTQLANGKSASEIRLGLKKKGIRIQPSSFSDIARNPVYISKIWVKTKEGGYYVKGIHEPLIDEQTFDRTQRAIQCHILKKNISVVQAFKEELHLRGHLLCSHCNRNLTGSASKGRNGVRHHYYHCNHCGKDRIRAEETHQKIEALLGELKVNTEATKLYEKMVRKLLSGQEKSRRPLSKIQEEIHQFEQRLKNTEDDLADRVIDIETFSRSKARFTTELSKLRSELSDHSSSSTAFEQFLKKGIHLLKDLPGFYKAGSVHVKREVIGSIFPEKLVVAEKKCRTTKINSAVLLITAIDKGSKGKEKGQSFKNLELSAKVEDTGVEPNIKLGF